MLGFRASALAVAIALFGLEEPAHAWPGSFSATLTIQVGSLPPVAAFGAGTGTFAGAGGSLSIPAGVFSLVTTAPISPPLLVVNGFGVGAPGQGGLRNLGTNPLNPGTNKALTWNGVTGTMGLSLSAYLITGLGGTQSPTTPTPTNLAAAIPLAIVGVGGNQKFTALAGLVMGTIVANPYQLGMVTVMGALQGVPSTLTGTGFDFRTAGGVGLLHLVSPTVVNLGALGSLPAISILTISNPEPGTFAMLGMGFVGLGVLRRRYVRMTSGRAHST